MTRSFPIAWYSTASLDVNLADTLAPNKAHVFDMTSDSGMALLDIICSTTYPNSFLDPLYISRSLEILPV